MGVTHRFVEHTGEVEVELTAATRAGLFDAATQALAELLGVEATATATTSWDVDVRASDDAALLVAWLDELVFRAEADGLVATRVLDCALEQGRARGRVAGVETRPPHLVKAATYHRLLVERTDGGWRGRVVLDV